MSNNDMIRITIKTVSMNLCNEGSESLLARVEFHFYQKGERELKYCNAKVEANSISITPYLGASHLPSLSENFDRNEKIYERTKELLRNYYAALFRKDVYVWM
jgi:hypothetical protein